MLPVKIDLNKEAKTYESPLIEEIEKEKLERINSKQEIMEPKFQDIRICPNKKIYDPKNIFKVSYVSGGYGHTAAITGIFKNKAQRFYLALEKGELFTWGLNVKGQLGVGDKISRYYPQMLLKDIMQKDLPVFKQVTCGYFNTFAIDGTCFILFSYFIVNLKKMERFILGVEETLGKKMFIYKYCDLNEFNKKGLFPRSSQEIRSSHKGPSIYRNMFSNEFNDIFCKYKKLIRK